MLMKFKEKFRQSKMFKNVKHIISLGLLVYSDAKVILKSFSKKLCVKKNDSILLYVPNYYLCKIHYFIRIQIQ